MTLPSPTPLSEMKLANAKLETNNRDLEESRKAMLNVMEDLETARTLIELEKAKDEAMLASIGDGLVAVDNEGKVMIINDPAVEMLGWQKQDLIGRVITELPLQDEAGNPVPISIRPTTIALATGKITKVTYFFVRQDKSRFPMAITATPIKLGGKTIGLVEIIRDVTQEQEVDRAKSEFVSLASHQLRTPLGIVKWYLEALGQEDYFKNSPEVVHKYFEEIYKSNERVLSLVRDLLSVSRIDQGRVKDVPKLVDVVTIVSEIVEQMQIVAKTKGVSLHLVVPLDTTAPITIDPLRFHEVIENLVGNAIEYTTTPGSVDVLVKKDGATLLIDVKDTGIGISPEDQKKLFTKFFRSEKAIGHNPEGSGLGLYVVKSYVEGWGGKVSLVSADGLGSTFTISLPL